jgi:hypothetical protein
MVKLLTANQTKSQIVDQINPIRPHLNQKLIPIKLNMTHKKVIKLMLERTKKILKLRQIRYFNQNKRNLGLKHKKSLK